ncbi:hypothetical protein Ancab_028345 [Ancistrocladus abbreviatus]
MEASLELEKAELGNDKTFGDEQQLGPTPLPLANKSPNYMCCANPIREQSDFKNQTGASSGDLSSNFELSNERKEVPQSSKGLSNNGSWASPKGLWAFSSVEVLNSKHYIRKVKAIEQWNMKEEGRQFEPCNQEGYESSHRKGENLDDTVERAFCLAYRGSTPSILGCLGAAEEQRAEALIQSPAGGRIEWACSCI